MNLVLSSYLISLDQHEDNRGLYIETVEYITSSWSIQSEIQEVLKI